MAAEITRRDDAREDWLEWRRQGLGGSDAAAVLGMSPYTSPVKLWLQKTGQLGPDEETERMRWGTLLENVIADEFERRTGYFVRGRQMLVTHPEHPWMRATLDGFVSTSADRGIEPLGNYEGKNSSWGGDWHDGVPAHIQIQAQHQLAVTGLERSWVTVLLNGNELRWFELERDEALIEALIQRESVFWHECVLARFPPAVDGSEVTTDAISAAFGEPFPNSFCELPDHALELLQEYGLAAAAEKEAATRKAEAGNALKLLLGEAQVGFLAGERAVSWTEVRSKVLDQERLKAEAPEIHARFTTERSSRRLTVHRATTNEEERPT